MRSGARSAAAAERSAPMRASARGLSVSRCRQRYRSQADAASSSSGRLAEIEDQLQHAQRFYNGAAKQYALQLESFPDRLVANLFRFRPMPYFEIDDRRERR